MILGAPLSLEPCRRMFRFSRASPVPSLVVVKF